MITIDYQQLSPPVRKAIEDAPRLQETLVITKAGVPIAEIIAHVSASPPDEKTAEAFWDKWFQLTETKPIKASFSEIQQWKEEGRG